jgi:hypothetical protein
MSHMPNILTQEYDQVAEEKKDRATENSFSFNSYHYEQSVIMKPSFVISSGWRNKYNQRNDQ